MSHQRFCIDRSFHSRLLFASIIVISLGFVNPLCGETPFRVKLVHGPDVKELRFLRGASFLASVSNSVRVWDCTTGNLIRSLETSNGIASTAGIGEWLVSLDDPQGINERGWYDAVPQRLPSIRVWDPISGRKVKSSRIQLPYNSSHLWTSRLEPSENMKAVFCTVHLRYSESTLREKSHPYKSDTSRLVGWSIPDLSLLCDFEIDSDPQYLIVSERDDIVLAYNQETLSAYSILKKKQLWTRTLCKRDIHHEEWLNHVGRYYANLDKDSVGTILAFVWNGLSNTYSCLQIDTATGESMKRSMSENAIGCLKSDDSPAWANDSPGGWVFIPQTREMRSFRIADEHRETLSMDATSELRRQCAVVYSNQFPSPRSTAWSESQQLLALTCEGDEAIHLFDVANRRRIAIPEGTVTGFSLGEKNRMAVAFDADRVVMTEMDGSNEKRILKCHGNVTCVALSRDDKSCAIGIEGAVEVWDRLTQRLVGKIKLSSDRLAAISFDESGLSLIAVDSGGCFWRCSRDIAKKWSAT